MGTCRYCGRSGLFLKTNRSRLCSACNRALAVAVENDKRILDDCQRLIRQSKNPDTRLSRFHDMRRVLQRMQEQYEAKGIEVISPAPSALLTEIAGWRDRIVCDRVQARVDKELDKAAKAKTTKTRGKALEAALSFFDEDDSRATEPTVVAGLHDMRTHVAALIADDSLPIYGYPRSRLMPEGSTSEPGTFRGRHYSEYVAQVEELKRQDKLVQAETLLLELVAATEAESKAQGIGVAPAYYEHLAVIYRKQGRAADEVAVLERYESQPKAPGVGPSRLAERLEKAKTLLARPA
ncbi:MAG: hypothetical protein IBX63_10725 [Coriobacteriia bacterium]|nr:hypothetical protein [Coriobacteriia bacterium]